jgi:hypothetical protein
MTVKRLRLNLTGARGGCWVRGLLFLPVMFALGTAVACLGQTVTPPDSTFFSTAAEEAYSTYQLNGNGDLWPSCWADNGNLYTANGDGTNFGSTFYPMAVGMISGTPSNLNLSGTFLAGDVGYNYSGSPYTDKPTGMLCVGGAVYLAYQNLNENTFEDAPAASIVESADHGVTWSQSPATPMFGTPGDNSNPLAYKFTTIIFLDYGQDYDEAIDNYVYAYGLDNDWRDQTAVYLARVPNTSVLDRSSWQFFAGMNGNTPTWTSDITQKAAVLTDERELYPTMFGTDCPANQRVIAQGGAVYDKPLNRYLMVTWGCATHELYEAPQPWGPWSLVLSNDFGPLRLLHNRGQYGTSIPSKFISSDGKTLYLQSNVCCSGDSYTFSLRRLFLEPYIPASPSNAYSTSNLAVEPGTRAISKSTHFGTLCSANCGDQIANGAAGSSEDDWDEEVKTTDWWGYTWPQPYNLNEIVYTTGTMFSNGGWYSSDLRIQVRQNFQWVDVVGATLSPPYPYTNQAGSQTAYTFTFPDTWGDGVRIIGTPGGTAYFTSIGSLAVYYTNSTTPPSFTIAAGKASPSSISAGSSATSTVTVAAANGYIGSVTLSCALTQSPSGATHLPSCSVTGGFVSLSATATTGTATATVTTTPASTSTLVKPNLSQPPEGEGGDVILPLLVFLCIPWRRKDWRAVAGMVIVFVSLSMLFGCGGGGSGNNGGGTGGGGGTTAGNYTFTVTGTGNPSVTPAPGSTFTVTVN